MKHRNARSRKWIVGAVALALSVGLANHASAQPPQRETIPDWQNMTPEQLQETLQNLPPDQQQAIQQVFQFITPKQQQQMLQNLPPEQQEQTRKMFQQTQMWLQNRMKQQRHDWIRQTISASGYTDTAVQDAIIDFMRSQEKARQPLRDAAHSLTDLLINPATTEDEFKKQLADFQDKVKKNDDLHNQELIALDEKINYSTQPRLKTLLTVLGVTGQESSSLGGLSALFPDSPFGNNRGTA